MTVLVIPHMNPSCPGNLLTVSICKHFYTTFSSTFVVCRLKPKLIIRLNIYVYVCVKYMPAGKIVTRISFIFAIPNDSCEKPQIGPV